LSGLLGGNEDNYGGFLEVPNSDDQAEQGNPEHAGIVSHRALGSIHTQWTMHAEGRPDCSGQAIAPACRHQQGAAMQDDQVGVMMALSMVLTALVKNLPADVAAKALKDLHLGHRAARS